jgi:hypothetical protein
VKRALIASITMVRSLVLLLPIVGLLACSPANASLVAPEIFQKRCSKCHGEAQVSGLDLHSRESSLRGGEHGKVIVPGDAANSRPYRLISGEESPRMPADGTSTAEQIETMRNRINAGANWDISDVDVKRSDAPRYWALIPSQQSKLPKLAKNPIDGFLARTMRNEGSIDGARLCGCGSVKADQLRKSG